jgi:hypothetical protein
MNRFSGMKIISGFPVFSLPDGTLPLVLKKEDFLYLGKEVCIWPQAKIINTKMVSIGHKSIIDDFTFIFAAGEPIYIGKFVHIPPHSAIV